MMVLATALLAGSGASYDPVKDFAAAGHIGTQSYVMAASSQLAAKSVAYGDPALGGASSIYFANLLQRLGIAEAMKGKIKLTASGESASGATDASCACTAASGSAPASAAISLS